jgi:hypothetical protein
MLQIRNVLVGYVSGSSDLYQGSCEHLFNADPDPAIFLIADPDLDQNPVCSKFWKQFFLLFYSNSG